MFSKDRLIILDADGTTIDAFSAIRKTFRSHGMDLGDLERFQKRRNLFKYLGGLKEFPTNLKKQIGKQKRARLIATLTEIYQEEACLYPGVESLIPRLIAAPGVRVGLVTRNITQNPKDTLKRLFQRHDIRFKDLDFVVHLPLNETKTGQFRTLRKHYSVNPALAYACGDERKDYEAAIDCGIHPFMVSYGFEDFERLTCKIGVPKDTISATPGELRLRVLHALGLVG